MHVSAVQASSKRTVGVHNAPLYRNKVRGVAQRWQDVAGDKDSLARQRGPYPVHACSVQHQPPAPHLLQARTGLQYVSELSLKTDKPSSWWILRGVALLCAID